MKLLKAFWSSLFYGKRIKIPFSVNNEINGFFRFSALGEFVIMFKW
ncbi:hypothetical protein GYO_0921 [Bacillus spizizenii TU-B-10]|uniref:Uncharacterized protein n=1 Tax=Bacillus spizizenii (strain DSM 15029 / JCM 12233 / NBRC 101239 / NRRL B-23049 / TU-B-10) TaxID=1052585 RepID=G4NU98_BACS4|nr:hypothetical protein GYO_0921 [Bacillus spizizenii TU-B-10]